MTADYGEFLQAKRELVRPAGFKVDVSDINSKLFPFQRDVVQWAMAKGRCAVFLDTGLGKTFVQLEWARMIGKRTLILAPLSVARQTVREGRKIGLDVRYVRSQQDVTGDYILWITNYEMLDSFDLAQFDAVVLDESSILKALDGRTRQRLIDACVNVPYRLCCSATPAPNDYTELGNHAQFLGVCTTHEMLAMFFVNANKQQTFVLDGRVYEQKGSNKGGQEWRLKHHAEDRFFQWLASWAITMTKPSDLGYSDDGFILPPLTINPVFVPSHYSSADQLFFTGLRGLGERVEVRRASIEGRLMALATIVNLAGHGYTNRYELAAKRPDQSGLLQEVLPGAQGTPPGTSEGSHGQDDPRTESGSERVHEGVQVTQHGQVETHSRAAGECKRTQERAICSGRVEENRCVRAGQGVASGQPRETESPAPKGIPVDGGRIQCPDLEAAGALCDLRLHGHREPEILSFCGSLPQDREGTRIAVHQLQPCAGQDDGRPGTTAESGSVSGEQWVIWCGLDDEQRAVEKLLGDRCVSIYGSLDPEEKERRLEIWLSGGAQFLVSKGKVCGFGLNLQQSHQMAFFGLSDSWETFYQSIRREWRYGQTEPVNVHIIMSDAEDAIYHNVMRKEAMANRLRQKLVEAMSEYERSELGMTAPLEQPYQESEASGCGWRILLGDSCERLKEIETESVDMSVYSPPFADLFTYSASDRDLGNSRGWDQFFEHYAFIIREVLRVTKQGRNTCVHTSDIPAMQARDGYIGMRDFPGEVIRAYVKEGWVFYGRAFVQKNPQAQAIRVRAKGLAFQQLRKDSADSRPALIDQILIFKKPGENAIPVNPVGNCEIDNETWIEWANGIWLGISETETLSTHTSRDISDEKHLCALQLGTIERCIKLYSNKGELVLTPFLGVGSEAYQAVKFGRRAIGIELKPSYFQTACKNLREAESTSAGSDLFAWADSQAAS